MADAAPPMAPAILLDDLRKDFAGTPVLAGVGLRVPCGRVFGYIGPNGAGKSTTVKILCGLLGGFSGRAEVAGIDVGADPVAVKRRIGYVPENAVLYEALTPREHLQLVGRLHGMEEAEIDVRTTALLAAFDLARRIDARIGALSKGMRQKLLISGALLHDPDIVFLDEPLSGLDVGSTILLKELVRGMAARGKTVFYCSHMMDVVERVCDEIAILDAGRVVAHGTFAELSAASPGGSLERILVELTSGSDAPERAARILAAVRGPGPGGSPLAV